MALTKLPKNAIGTGAVKSNNIADGTIQNQDVSGSISNDKLANSSFTINGTSVSLGASQSVITYLDWQAVQVADGSTQVNAESGKGYFLDTNAGVIEVFLPTSPSRGDVVGLVDYAGTFGTNQLIINTGGINIDSTVGSEFKVTTNNAIVECVYVDSAKGWLVYINQAAGTTPSGALTGYSSSYDTPEPFIAATGGTITTSGDYKIHTFTGDGCFVVSNIGLGTPTNPSTVDYLVVAGGGGGGFSRAGAGGAGGYRESYNPCTSGTYTASPLATPTSLTVSITSYPVTIGAGGAGAPEGCSGSPGVNSVFSTITSAGGGGGASNDPHPGAGVSGGSGGGGMNPSPGPQPGGAGNTPPTSPPQGNPGGTGVFTPPYYGAGGGGGATSSGGNGTSTVGGAGGNGAGTQINNIAPIGAPGPSPTSRYFAGGGGGGGNTGTSGAPGYGGGGIGGEATTILGNGVTNTGGGAGGGSGVPNPCYNPTPAGGNGGSGIVIIRYKYQ